MQNLIILLRINIKDVGDNKQVFKTVFVRLWEVWRKLREDRLWTLKHWNIDILIYGILIIWKIKWN